MLSYCVDTMGYLLSSTLMDDFLAVGAVASCICVVRILFYTRSENL